DGAGHQTEASAVVTVANDSRAPTVALDTPTEGATVTGVVGLIATALDDIGVAGVQFRVDGAPVGAERTAAPDEVLWSTAALVTGVHTVTVVPRDASGHEATSSVQV